jgi:hypothetical protein
MKEDLSKEDVKKFEKAVCTLSFIEAVNRAEVGKPASTNRPIIERSYSYSLLLMFDNLAAHDKYQVDPVHLKFVADCSTMWTKVLIFDSESIA